MRILHVLVFSSTWFYSCKKWDPNVQFENDIISQKQVLAVQEEQSNIAKQEEINNFVQYLSRQTMNNGDFLNWSKKNDISFKITAVATLNQENWETREYEFENLIHARYGFESEISRYYRKNKYPNSLSIITNGTRIINPHIN